MQHSPRRGSRLSAVLIGLLLCSNLATALVAWIVIDRIHERYAAELNGAVPGLHDVMLLAQEATNVHRAALNLPLVRDEAERAEVLDRLAQARERETQRLRQVFPDGEILGSPRAPLWDAAHDYGVALDAYLSLLDRGAKNEAMAFRTKELRPAFDQYQTRQREESIRLNFEAMKMGAEISALVTTRKGLLLGFGVWPLLLAALMLVTVGVLAAVLWRSLSHVEATDGALTPPESARF